MREWLKKLFGSGENLSPEARSFVERRLDENDMSIATYIGVSALPFNAVMFILTGASRVMTFVYAMRALNVILVLSAATYLFFGHRTIFKKYLKANYAALFGQITYCAILALYTHLSYMASSNEVSVFTRVVEGNEQVLVASGQTLYDVLVSSTFFLVASTIVIFIQPVHGKAMLVTNVCFTLLAFFAYRLHDDRLTWWGYTGAAHAAATLFVTRLKFRNRREALLEFENLKLVERQATLKVEREMELAKEIQDSMAPPPESRYGNNWSIHCYQIAHHKVGGDWMAVRQTGDGRMILLVADATGKGMQAALVVHAVQSLWANTLDNDAFDVRSFLDTVNRTLLKLGKSKPHTMTMGIIELSATTLTYWSAAHCPIYVMQTDAGKESIKTCLGSGDVLGMSDELTLFPAKYAVPEGATSIDILHGSDGIFDGIPKKRKGCSLLLRYLRTHGLKAVEWIPADDDKTLIWLNYSTSVPATA